MILGFNQSYHFSRDDLKAMSWAEINNWYTGHIIGAARIDQILRGAQ